jgi:hypothetical protein
MTDGMTTKTLNLTPAFAALMTLLARASPILFQIVNGNIDDFVMKNWFSI